jgi:hypothetical protein
LADIDKDGDLDIFIGGRVINGSYPNSPQSYFLANEQGNFVDKTFEVFSDDTDFGMVSDAIFTDFNNDDWLDLIVVGEFMEVRFFLNTKGKLSEITASTGLKNMSGWWNSIVSSDFDQDGDTDYIVGNLGQNSDVKASESEPVTLYAKDFDKNGSVDPLMSCFRNGEEHLIHPRDVLIGQISAMRNRFVDYESYANASMENILWTKDLKEALILKADNFQSTYIENLGNSKFKSASLPIQAQFAPVYGMQVNDYNHDGFLDVFLAGNHYDVEPFMGPYDASIGTLFYGDGMGGFTYVSASESGLKNNGDAKGMATLLTKEGSVLTLIGQNSNKLLAYESKIIGQILPAQPFEVSAWVYLRNGKKIKYEFTYGNAYLSQSSRFIVVDPQKTLKVEFKTAKGEIRKTEW